MSNEDFLKMLIRHEGNIPYAYKDSLGYWTIGVGFLIDKEKGGKLEPEEIQFILQNRIDKLVKELAVKLPWMTELTPTRQAVLVNMAFNLGVNGLLGFKNTLAFVRAGEYEKAARGMLASKWASQVKGRAVELAELMRKG